jgi:arylsulfatase A-like enzyme
MARTNHRLLIAALALALAACSEEQRGAARPSINVLVVVVDTLRADYADPQSGKAELPHLSAFARDAVVFPNAFSHAPMTLPAHAALFSSRTPEHSGVSTNGQSISQELPLLSEWLAKRGYASQAAVSLATLWPGALQNGLDRGFEQFDRGRAPISNANDTNHDLGSILDGLKGRDPFFVFAHYAEPHEPYEAHGSVERTAGVSWNQKLLETVLISEWSHRLHELMLEPGVNRLEVHSESPFKVRSLTFSSDGPKLAVQYEVGLRLEACKDFVASVENPTAQPLRAQMELWLHDVPSLEELPQRYRRETEAADAAFGRLIAMLKERGLYDSTLIVFTSDHGEALGEHGVVGHVVNLYDELLHVPLMIKLPREHPAFTWLGRSQRDLVRHVDVVPTLLDALSLPAMPGQEGISLLGDGERTLFAQTSKPEAPRTLMCLRDLRSKLVYDVAADSFTMYDLIADPGESVDIFPQAGAQKVQWQRRLREIASRPPTLQPGAGLQDEQTRERMRSLGY